MTRLVIVIDLPGLDPAEHPADTANRFLPDWVPDLNIDNQFTLNGIEGTVTAHYETQDPT